MRICAVTGHRVLRGDFSKERLAEALKERIKAGTDTFLCGMALGFDLLCGETIALLKETYQLRVVACITCADQSSKFSPSARRRYEALLRQCDDCVTLYERYKNGCMFERNRFMVEHCDEVLAYWQKDLKKGGTYYTVQYALRMEKPVYFVE